MAAAKKRWVSYGPTRGLGPIRDRSVDAMKDAAEDQRKCAGIGGTSDRVEYQIDVDGYLRTPDGGFVYAKPKQFEWDHYTMQPVPVGGDERDGAVQI